MSPTANTPGRLVWNFSVSTVSAFFSSANPHSAIGPSFGCKRLERAVGGADVDTAQHPVVDDQRVRQRLDAAHARGRHLLLHAGDRGGGGAGHGPPPPPHTRRPPRPATQRP